MTAHALPPLADRLATWAFDLEPTTEDLLLAQRSLVDTVAVTLAARRHPIGSMAAVLGVGGRWAAIGHVLDFDDLHLESTAHVSVVSVPTALATGGDAKAFLVAAGVMARLGAALGWRHYASGWHATCTAGAPAAAAGAAVAMGLTPTQIATAISLAVPAAGGVQRAFGTDAKALQVGFAVDAGIRAAQLAAAGASADHTALDVWLTLVGGAPSMLDLSGPAVPGGLAIKLFPCCYALQRPISALIPYAERLDPDEVLRIVVRTPASTLVPLIHSRPTTGLQGKFSLHYATAAALLDGHPGFASFTDAAVRRPKAHRLMELVEVQVEPGGEGLLDGRLQVEVHLSGGTTLSTHQKHPCGSPQLPATPAQLELKVEDCLRHVDADPGTWAWHNAADILRA